MTNEELIEEIKRLGEGCYREVRMLDDGTIVGIGDLLFTRAIYLDMNLDGWGRRFCFQDKPLADEQFKKLTDGDTEPVGWIARR